MLLTKLCTVYIKYISILFLSTPWPSWTSRASSWGNSRSSNNPATTTGQKRHRLRSSQRIERHGSLLSRIPRLLSRQWYRQGKSIDSHSESPKIEKRPESVASSTRCERPRSAGGGDWTNSSSTKSPDSCSWTQRKPGRSPQRKSRVLVRQF